MNALAYEVVGSGPPLILLHGLSGSGRWWSRNVPVLARSFRTYSIDLPGFGGSRAIRWSRLDDTADRLADWLAEEGLPKAHIAGHSLGGAVAARLAARYPERVDRLVLVDAAIRPQGTRPMARPVRVMRAFSRDTLGFTRILAHDLLRCHPRSFIAATVDALQTDWEPHLGRIDAPTLVVWGEHDAITPLALGQEITAAVPYARLLSLAETGHNPMWQRADLFNAEVLRFLGDRDDTGMRSRHGDAHHKASIQAHE